MRRYKVLYPKPTTYQTASTKVIEEKLLENGDEAKAIRRKLLARIIDVSEFMKTVKQRFSAWFRDQREFKTKPELAWEIIETAKANELDPSSTHFSAKSCNRGA